MRKQIRPPAPPQFVEHAAKWCERWLQLKAKTPGAKFPWYSIDGKSAREWALPMLREMNQGHCSFCDASPLDDRTKEPIEHFRPKGNKDRPEFAALAYEWSNLYYCCPFCQSEKAERWHDALIAPDEIVYEFSRYFRFDFTGGETGGKIEPNPDASDSDRARAAATIQLYGLDKAERRRGRMKALRDWSNHKVQVIDESPYRDFVEPG